MVTGIVLAAAVAVVAAVTRTLVVEATTRVVTTPAEDLDLLEIETWLIVEEASPRVTAEERANLIPATMASSVLLKAPVFTPMERFFMIIVPGILPTIAG